MIIDCYPSSFAQWDSAAGYKSRAEKMEVIHRELATHHQHAWRARDRTGVDNSSLINPDTGELTNAEWTRHMGQLAWTYEGETYVKQYFPPMLHNMECPPELMIAEMDYAGIDAGILHTHPHKGRYTFQNEFQRNVVNRYPDRLMRLVMVEAHSIPCRPREGSGGSSLGGLKLQEPLRDAVHAPLLLQPAPDRANRAIETRGTMEQCGPSGTGWPSWESPSSSP